jgi:hypothetical protein
VCRFWFLSWALASLGLALGGSMPVRGEAADSSNTVWLNYHHNRNAQSVLRHLQSHTVKVEAAIPAGLALPEGLGEDVRVAKWSTPMDQAKFRYVALGCSQKDAIYDRLAVDCNGDGLLSDEIILSPYHLQPYRKDNGRAYFGPIQMQFVGDDGPIVYHLNVTLGTYGKDHLQAMAGAGCWYQGEVQIDGQPVPVQLLDFNGNGTFDDTCGPGLNYVAADRIRFTTQNAVEPVLAGKYVRHEGKFYEVIPARDGASLSIRPAVDLATGVIEPSAEIDQVRVFGLEGSFLLGKGESRVVPAGRYLVESWERLVQDDRGQAWKFTGAMPPKASVLEVAGGATVALDLSAPYIAKLDHQVRGDRHTFGQKLSGRLGEAVSVNFNNGQRPQAPRLRIVNADGQYDQTFKFEYG